jgi:hypothetical protein
MKLLGENHHTPAEGRSRTASKKSNIFIKSISISIEL